MYRMLTGAMETLAEAGVALVEGTASRMMKSNSASRSPA